MRIYLDTCTIQRPLDTLDQTRLRLEAEAILGILEKVDAGELELLSSTVLELELARNALAVRREHGEKILAQALAIVVVDKAIEERALGFTKWGLDAMDAFHLAAAESASAAYLCTCDDRFLRQAKRITDLGISVVSPLELFEVLEK